MKIYLGLGTDYFEAFQDSIPEKGKKYFFCPTFSDRICDSASLLWSGYLLALLTRLYRKGCEMTIELPCSAKFKNEWRYISTPLICAQLFNLASTIYP
jgi:hypothetical protein